MDFFNNLLTTAAGYFGNEASRDAQLKLAQIGQQTEAQKAAAAATQQQTMQAASQIIPGVSNTTTFAIGGGVVVLGILAVVLTRGGK